MADSSPKATNDVPANVAAQADSLSPETANHQVVIQQTAYRKYSPSKSTLPQNVTEIPGEWKPGEVVKHGPAPGDIVAW